MKLEVTHHAIDYTELISNAVVYEHLKVDSQYFYGSEADLIESYMNSALQYCAEITGRLLKTSTDDSDVVVTLDRDDKSVFLNGISGVSIDTFSYLNSDFTYVEYTDYKLIDAIYPYSIRLGDMPSDLNSDVDSNLFKITMTGGDLISSLPSQYKQAVLLLGGHYFLNREAEYIGGVTNEIKEGVRRLLQSVRRY